MEIQSITTKVPEYSEAFIFGSVFSSPNPKDLDLLVIYDEHACPPQQAYANHNELCQLLCNAFNLPVHIIPLTRSEARHSRFIEYSKAIPLAMALRELTTGST